MTGAAMTGGVTRWWWVRHAPILAPPGIIAGRADLPCDLSDGAVLDALAAMLPRGAVWTATPLSRARDTAGALLARLGEAVEPRIEPAFLEQDFGDWQGLVHGDLADDPVAAAFWMAPATNAPPGGQSFAAMAADVAAGIDRLSAAHAGRDIVCVAHAGPIRAAVGHALGLSPERMLALVVDCLHICRLDRIDGEGPAVWRVAGVNLPPR